MTGRPEYERIRAAHLDAVQATLDDHVGRLDWSAEQIRRHRDQGCGHCLPTPASVRRSTPTGCAVSTSSRRRRLIWRPFRC